jgi:hypothetical protein
MSDAFSSIGMAPAVAHLIVTAEDGPSSAELCHRVPHASSLDWVSSVRTWSASGDDIAEPGHNVCLVRAA